MQPVLRMSGNTLIQRHGISWFRVSVGCPCFWGKFSRPRTLRSVTSFRIRENNNLTVRSEYANDNKTRGGFRSTSLDQKYQNSTNDPWESWKLWQTMNRSVKEIGRQGLPEFEVYEQICECVQQGKGIDWFALCEEAGFTPATVLEINDAKSKAEEAMNEPLGQRLDEFGLVPVQCGLHVTDVHVLLYNTMMACGITPHEMFRSPIELPLSQVPEKPPAPKKALLNSKSSTESKRAASTAVPSSGNGFARGKLTATDKTLGLEEADTKKTPKRLTQKHMLQWMTDRNGVTLMELDLEFQGYNECQLMRLILLLERKKLIQLSKGIFRVTSPSELQLPRSKGIHIKKIALSCKVAAPISVKLTILE